MSLFEYNDGSSVLPKNALRISPSQLSRFFDQTSQWYAEFLKGEAPAFTGSTATHLGTCVHACAEMFANGNVDYFEVEKYINSINDPEVDKSVIKSQYGIMYSTLESSYLSRQPNKGVEVEKYVTLELLPNIFVAGSVDRYSLKAGGTITDFKTMGSLDSARVPTSFPRAYYFQQLTYAYVMRKLGYEVSQCELVYVSRNNTGRVSTKTGKPMKDYPSQVNVLVHQITEDDMALIESILQLVAESMQAWNKQPEIRHLLSQDMRNKVKTPVNVFTRS
jgi:hypothetical protein